MPFIKVHISSLEAPANKSLLTRQLRKVMLETLEIDEKIGQVVLYETQPQYRAIHAERSNNFVFLEVLMYPGRTMEMKETFMKGLVEAVNRIIKVDIQDINCCLQEISQDNWYGGISHKYIK
jgi:phenylpyruvate tautomerase PptA (4-oxalocrotonate tautomerase family)